MQRDRDRSTHYEDLEARYDLPAVGAGSSRRATGARAASSWCRSPRPTRPTTTSSPTGCPTGAGAAASRFDVRLPRAAGRRTARCGRPTGWVRRRAAAAATARRDDGSIELHVDFEGPMLATGCRPARPSRPCAVRSTATVRSSDEEHYAQRGDRADWRVIVRADPPSSSRPSRCELRALPAKRGNEALIGDMELHPPAATVNDASAAAGRPHRRAPGMARPLARLLRSPAPADGRPSGAPRRRSSRGVGACGPLLHRACAAGADRLSALLRPWSNSVPAVPRPAAAGAGDPQPVRDPVRLGLGRLLDRDGRLLRAAARRATATRSPRPRARGAAHRRRRAHRDRHADLQRGRGARVRRPARDLRVARAHRRARRISTSSCCSDSSEPDTARRRARTRGSTLRARVDGFGRIFYRWRQHRIKRKSGNVADFCRRWGSDYRYMVVLDADSVMSGDCLTTLVRLMEANPTRRHHPDRAAAPPAATRCMRASQQFATARLRAAVHRRPALLAARRIALLGPQRDHPRRAVHAALRAGAGCPGAARCRGEILSHDFVEAALMRRAGWGVWIAYDLPGSYEEMPPNLLDELQRDRRWCQGNLKNFRLFLRERPASGAPRGVRDRRDGLRVGAAVVRCSWCCRRVLLAVHALSEPAVLRRAVPAVSRSGPNGIRHAHSSVHARRPRCCSCRRCSASC